MEMIGFLPDLMEQMYKVFSTRLCANSVGQVVAGVMVNPPKPGEPSYPLFNEVGILYVHFDRSIIVLVVSSGTSEQKSHWDQQFCPL